MLEGGDILLKEHLPLPLARRLRLGSMLVSQWPLAIVGLACFFFLFAQRHIGLSLMDEGFLWYGAQRILHGELPLRDFQAYDPARYYWSAGWMYLLGDNGIVTLRLGNAILAAMTAMLAVFSVNIGMPDRRVAFNIAAGVVFIIWLVPDFKVADSFAAILLLFSSVRLIERPTSARYFQGGICLGIAAAIGINHALYGTIGGLLTFFYAGSVSHKRTAIGAVIAGGLLGYSPMLALFVFAPGFAAAFIDSITLIFEAGTTNLSLPFPDVLAVFRGADKLHVQFASETLLGLSLIAAPLLLIWAAWRLGRADFRAIVPPAIPAGLLLSLPFAHYVVSRADVAHAAVSVLPVLVLVLAWTAWRRGRLAQWLIVASLLLTGLAMTARERPAYEWLKNARMYAVAVDGVTMLLPSFDFAQIRSVRTLATAAGPATFFAGPYLPGAYALQDRKSPIWEIYMIFPSSPARQRAEIMKMRAANVCVALVSNGGVDGNAALGLQQTHRLLLAELEQRLERSEDVVGMMGMTIRSTAAHCDRRQAPPGESSES